MRRWNGWGDDTIIYELPETATAFLEQVVGPGKPQHNARIDTVLKQVPSTRLPDHPLITIKAEDRVRHARGQSFPDWVAMRFGQFGAFPDGVAYPSNSEEVRTLIEYAQTHNVHLIPYGGGSSVVGHINPLPDPTNRQQQSPMPTLTIDLCRMNRLQRFDDVSNLFTFGAGVKGPDLEAQLRARGRTLGHYPQSFEYSTLGGWIATRSSGQQSLAYGRIENMFAGGIMEAPMGKLEIPSKVPASAAGPDLRELILGSEGRLGILTEATVRVHPLPEREEFHGVFFPNFAQGRAAVREMLQDMIPLSMLRLSTPIETQTTLAMAGHKYLLAGLARYLALRGIKEEKCMLIFSVTGSDALSRLGRREALRIAGKHGGVYATQIFGKQWNKSRFTSPYLRNALWDAGYGIDTLETAIDWAGVTSLLKTIEQKIQDALQPTGERVHVFSHLSRLYPHGSSIYVQYLFRLADTAEETLARWSLMKSAASTAIVTHGATISHQHGVGTDHKSYLAAEKGDLGMAMLQAALKCFDPQRIMNPGKMIDQGSVKQ